MIKFEHCEVVGWEHAIRGMRNPMNSWDKSDSIFNLDCNYICCEECPERGIANCVERLAMHETTIGPNDRNLMMHLRDAGTDHRKFMRMINVYVDITAPLYWWKEFDTYKVGTVANSCSTMHKIHAKEFELDDFSHEHLDDTPRDSIWVTSAKVDEDEEYNGHKVFATAMDILKYTIEMLNAWREEYLETKDKKSWWQMIQLLPSSYNQRRTIMMNYEVLANIYKSRKNHKLDEWRTFCSWIEELPYSEIIVGELEEDPNDILISDEIMAEAKRRILEEFENARLFPAPFPKTGASETIEVKMPDENTSAAIKKEIEDGISISNPEWKVSMMRAFDRRG